MGKIRAALLFGGKSGEHEVSLISAASVYRHLDRERFEIELIAVDRDGCWYHQKEARFSPGGDSFLFSPDPSNLVFAVPGKGLRTLDAPVPADVVFPVLHGTFGEDGTIQGLLELCNLPYAGAGVLGSSLCMDKAAVKRIWLQAGLPVVPFEELREASWLRAGMDSAPARKAVGRFGFPIFVKPARAGSSVGVARCDSTDAMEKAIADAFRFDDKLLLEPAVKAREIECSVIGNQVIRSFAPGEIIPSHDFYDYEAKYLDPTGAALVIPADLPDEVQKRVRQISTRAYRIAEAEGFARVDCFVRAETGEILLNEINTIPGFTSISMFPKMCEEGGLAYGELLSHLLDLAVERHRKRGEKSYQWS